MQVTHNQPCPCGSGKKYKHCCMPKQKLGIFDRLYNYFLNDITNWRDAVDFNRRRGSSKIIGMFWRGAWWPPEMQAFLLTIFTLLFIAGVGLFAVVIGVISIVSFFTGR